MNRRLPLTTPVISYPAPLPLPSRLPSVCNRSKVPHSSESQVPFTLIAEGSFWASSHALPSTSPLTAVREIGKEMQSNSNAAVITSRFMFPTLSFRSPAILNEFHTMRSMRQRHDLLRLPITAQ